MELTNLMRDGKAVSRPIKTKIRPGDLLLLNGHIDRIIEMENTYGIEMLTNARSDLDVSSSQVRLIEILLPQGVMVIGSHESLPEVSPDIIPFIDSLSLFQKKD